MATLLLECAAGVFAASADAQPKTSPALSVPTQAGFPPFLFAAEGAGKIIEYGRGGKIVWEYPAEFSRDVWMLPNGNILFCYNNSYNSAKNDNASGVMEVTRDKKIVFQYATTGQVWSCQRLADGSTMVGASSQGKLLIVNPQGQIIREIKMLNTPGHSCIRNARQIANGNFLAAEESAHAVREYSPEGKMLHETKVSFAPYSVVRLPQGATLICGEQTMAEVDANDKITWSLDGKSIPQIGVRWFAGIQALPNGNIFISNAGGKVPFLEVSRDHSIVWQSPENITIPIGHGIQRLDVPGPVLR